MTPPRSTVGAPPPPHPRRVSAWLHAARALFVLAGTLPWIVPIVRARWLTGSSGDALDAVFVTLCHRIPERTIAIAGVVMPVCSRCAGLYGGIALGAIAVWPASLLKRHLRAALIASAAPMVIDVITQDVGLHAPWHPIRIATGALFGYVAAACFMSTMIEETKI